LVLPALFCFTLTKSKLTAQEIFFLVGDQNPTRLFQVPMEIEKETLASVQKAHQTPEMKYLAQALSG
jgi:hypothetical protein